MPSEFTREDYEHAARAACPWCEEHALSLVLQGSQDADNGPTSSSSKEGLVLRCSGLIGCPDTTGVCDTEAEAWGYYTELTGRAAIEIGKSMKGTP